MATKSQSSSSKSKALIPAPIPSFSLDQLIRQQGAKPVADLDALSALWPSEHDPDAFAKFIREERTARRSAKPRRKTA